MLFSRFTDIKLYTERCRLLAHIWTCPVRLVSIEDPYHLPFTVFVEESFVVRPFGGDEDDSTASTGTVN